MTTGEAAQALPGPDDAEILRRLSGRQQDGLQLLLEKYGANVRWWLRKEYAQSLGDAELDEAMNLAAFAVWRSFRTFDARRGTLRAWFYVIARRSAIGVLRRELKARRRRVPEDVDLTSLEARRRPSAEAHEGREGFLGDLQVCLDGLTTLQRQVLQADLQSDHIADAGALAVALGTTANSIYASRSMGRKALRKCLVAKGHDFENGSSRSGGERE